MRDKMTDKDFTDREHDLLVRKSAGWKMSLRDIGEDIFSVMRDAEEGFLSIGEDLNEFKRMSGEITDLSSRVASLISEDEFAGLIRGLKTVLDRLKTYHGQFSSGIVVYTDKLSQLLEHIKAVSAHVADLRGIAKNLQFLSLATKIQSAVTGSAASGFQFLALNVQSLTLNVLEKTDAIARSVKALMEKVTNTLTKAMQLESAERKETKMVLDSAVEIVRSLEKKRDTATLFSEDILFRAQDVSKRIDKVVMSMQFHDITRQKIEHVKEAMDFLCVKEWIADKDTDREEGDESSNEVELAEVIHVAALQSSQLRSARKELTAATKDILRNISDISRSTTELIRETAKIIKGEGADEDSFVEKMEKGLSSVTNTVRMLTRNVAAAQELSGAVDMFMSVIREMSSFTSDMEQIESEIEVLALNAGIRAGQIGEKGAGLGKIAMNIQILSGRTHVPTVEIAESMRTITTIAEDMLDLLRSEEKAREEILTEALSELNDLLGTFRDLDRKIQGDLRAIEHNGQHLAWEIERTVEGVNVHELTADVLERAAGNIERTINGIMKEIPRYNSRNLSDILSGLAGLYTMQSERDIHKSYTLSGGRAGRETGDWGNQFIERDDTGEDNVELFS